MTLKTRLTAMMVIVLVAVVAVQFLLAERERRALAARLSQLGRSMDLSTATFVERAHDAALGRPGASLEELVAAIRADSARGLPTPSKFRVFVWGDTLGLRPQVLEFPDRPLGGGAALQVEETIVVRDTSGGGTAAAKRIVFVRHEGRFDSTASRGEAPQPRLEKRSAGDAGQDIVINLPLPHPGSDSLFSVQMRYSYASLTDELARTRRREMVALAGLLAVGIAGVFVVATRFTRPIQALEASFGRLVQGDLDVRVEPRRQDEIGHLTGSFNEMVERLRESRRMGERLAEAEHLASLGRLAAGVAHEIRNPLNAMLLAVEQMRSRVARASESGGGDAARREFERYDALIGDEISRLDRIVASFLDLARSAEVDRRPCDLADGLRATVLLFRPLAEQRDVRLDADLPAALPAVADALRLRTVWNNLLANAIEATPANGRVSLCAGARDGGIEVEIADTGRGIPADERARVWEPFWSGRDQGTGLGLSIVRSVVERHGGRVALDCPPEGGTRVRVSIPSAPPEGAA